MPNFSHDVTKCAAALFADGPEGLVGGVLMGPEGVLVVLTFGMFFVVPVAVVLLISKRGK